MRREQNSMNPKEASEVMRLEAIELLNLLKALQIAPAKNFSSFELKNWLMAAMIQFSEFKWNMAELFEELSKKHDFKLEKIDQNGDSKFTMSQMNLDSPPFEVAFFEKER